MTGPTCLPRSRLARYLPAHMTTSILQRSRTVVAVLATMLLCTSCTSAPPLPGDLKVGEITTGRILGPDGTITEESRTTLFWTTDTFYVAVVTDGAAQNVRIAARWTDPRSG